LIHIHLLLERSTAIILRCCYITTYDDFQERIKDGGFFIYDWDGTSETEEQLKADTQATIRCIPDALSQDNLGTDMISGKPAVARVYIARSY